MEFVLPPSDGTELLYYLFFAIALLPTYFLPAIIGSLNAHSRSGWIWMLNIVVGWTVLGWVALTVWSIFDLRDLNAHDEAHVAAAEDNGSHRTDS